MRPLRMLFLSLIGLVLVASPGYSHWEMSISCHSGPSADPNAVTPNQFIAQTTPDVGEMGTGFNMLNVRGDETGFKAWDVGKFIEDVKTTGKGVIPLGFSKDEIPELKKVPGGNDSEIWATGMRPKYMRSASFDFRVDGADHFLSSFGEPAADSTYIGKVEGAHFSLIVLYLREARTLYASPGAAATVLPAMVTGFVLFDKRDPDSLQRTPSWIFIEPIIPLATAAEIRPRDKASGGKVDYTEIDFTVASGSTNRCFGNEQDDPVNKPAMLTYKAGTAKDLFELNVDPIPDAKPSFKEFLAPCEVRTGENIQINYTIVNLSNQSSSITENPLEPQVVAGNWDNTVINYSHTLMPPKTLATMGGSSSSMISEKTYSDNLPNTLSPGVHLLRIETLNSARNRLIYVTDSAPFGSGYDTDCDSLIDRQYEPLTVPVMAEADKSFYNFYTSELLFNGKPVKMWWEAQEEVLNLVDSLFTERLPNFRFETQSVGYWQPNMVSPNDNMDAYNLLCGFTDMVQPSTDITRPLLVHLFSGEDLGELEEPSRAVSDVGDSLCPLTCTMVNSAIVGLASGVLGWRGENIGTARCPYSISDLDDSVPYNSARVIFNSPSHHSLTQHFPKPTLDQNDPKKNYHGTLYQRFLLVAHELGHTLGANHSPHYDSIMSTPLSDAVNFKLEAARINEITLCRLYCGPSPAYHPMAASQPGTFAVSSVALAETSQFISFSVQGIGIQAIEVDVFDLGGQNVFSSGLVAGNTLYWPRVNQHNQPLANGVYLYLVTTHGVDGAIERSSIKKLVIFN